MPAVPKTPRDHCYFCRAGEHAKCDENAMTLCACNHAGHPTEEVTA